MIFLLSRNKVRDFARWKAVFDRNQGDAEAAGLRLERMWRGVDDPNNVFFIMSVADAGKARAFLAAPEGAESGREAGVVEGEYWFVSDDRQ